jgi:hydroxymethylbilane synthase
MQLRIGSRTSPLAMAQTHWVVNALAQHHAQLHITVVPISTVGDERLDSPLHMLGDKGLFTKALEVAMQEDRIDLAIHSAKDLPTTLPAGFYVQSVGPRENPQDVLLGCPWADLPQQAVIGTSSLRRIAQLQRLRPDLICLPIRGNLQTRLRKLQQGQCHALMLAAAGVHRLMATDETTWTNTITHYFDPVNDIIPAAGQGILAAEFQHPWVKTLLEPLVNAQVETAWQAERAFLHTLEGGCQVPIGGHVAGNTLYGIWFDGDAVYQGQAPMNSPGTSPEQTGNQLAKQLQAEQRAARLAL